MKKTLLFVLIATFTFSASAHVGEHPSFQDAMAGAIARLRENHDYNALRRMRESDILEFLNDEERHTFGTEYISFDLSEAATIYVAVHDRQRNIPYWLKLRGFKETGDQIMVKDQGFNLWKKDFDKGHAGLGINSFDGYLPHYFAIIGPRKKKSEPEIENIYPGQHRTAPLREGARPYRDEGDWQVQAYPEALEGATLLQMIADRGEESQLCRIFRETPYPATPSPDQIVLTWGEDARHEVTVQWRAATAVSEGAVRYWKAGAAADASESAAEMTVLEDPYLANDPVIHRFTAELEGLEPGTAYTYQAGIPAADTWSGEATFTTAPAGETPFSFVYMGDAQNGLDDWGTLVQKAYAEFPEAAFYVMAGDLVNRGNERDDWDSLFHNAAGIYDRRPVVPAIGNHECQGSGPWMYLETFDLPENGPEGIEAERAYAVRYSNALFLVLDTNLPVHLQTDWLEDQLKNTDATWKFVVYHHPAYSSSPNRDNYMVRKQWGELFDRYHVDMALQGHDHAYLRTYPMKNEQRAGSAKEGTVYVVSVAGTKYYDQGDFDYTVKSATNLSTFQVLDIAIQGNRLTYRAYDGEGRVFDELIIEK
jgi:acid phosphatase type 7